MRGAGGGDYYFTGNFRSTKILSIQGGPVYVQKSGEQEWREGKLKMEIKTGDRVKTDPGSLATIVFFEGSTVELESDTEIR